KPLPDRAVHPGGQGKRVLRLLRVFRKGNFLSRTPAPRAAYPGVRFAAIRGRHHRRIFCRWRIVAPACRRSRGHPFIRPCSLEGPVAIISDIIRSLESWAPETTAESWDNVGLQAGNSQSPVRRALVALDLTPAVVDEAVEVD